MPDWSNLRNSFFRRLTDMSSLFRPGGRSRRGEEWARIVERRSSPTFLRLRAGIFLSYQTATGAKETDYFERDAKTWALFEHAVLPELEDFTFFDKSREIFVSPSAVLADGMFHLWTSTDLELEEDGRPTTVAAVTALAHYLCTIYETKKIDRRSGKRNWLGLNRR